MADGDSFDNVFRRRRIPPGTKRGNSGGPKGVSTFHGPSEVEGDWLGDSRVRDILRLKMELELCLTESEL
jgi:hypothetical protein